MWLDIIWSYTGQHKFDRFTIFQERRSSGSYGRGIANKWGNNLSILSLNRTDRLRLIDFDKSVSKLITQTLSCFYEKEYTTSIGKYHGAIEFKLRGSPFDCQGSKSVDSHLLICSVLQSLSCDSQYDILTTIKVSDKVCPT